MDIQCIDNHGSLIPDAGEAGSTRCSPMHPSRTSIASSSSFPQALNAVRSSPPISPITQLSAHDAGKQRDQRSRNLHLDLTVMNLQEPDEEPVDKEEVGGQNCIYLHSSIHHSFLIQHPNADNTIIKFCVTVVVLSYSSCTPSKMFGLDVLGSMCIFADDELPALLT